MSSRSMMNRQPNIGREYGLWNRLRPGAILVCVLVVMLMVGLISAQTIQTLLILRRADSERSDLVQARELLELGKMAIQQNSIPPNGQFELAVDGRQATVQIEQIEADQAETARYRIRASCSKNEVDVITVTWESPR